MSVGRSAFYSFVVRLLFAVEMPEKRREGERDVFIYLCVRVCERERTPLFIYIFLFSSGVLAHSSP